MNFGQFQNLARQCNVIPLVKTILADMFTPVSVYSRVREESSSSFLFESVEGNEKIGRYSFIGIQPRVTIQSRNGETEILFSNRKRKMRENFFVALEELLGMYSFPKEENKLLPRFKGGFVGFIGYDMIRFIETLPRKFDDEKSLDASLSLFAFILAFDHVTQQLHIIHNVLLDSSLSLHHQFSEGMKLLSEMEEKIFRNEFPAIQKKRFSANIREMTSNASKKEFEENVMRAKEYIFSGDVFQVVLSQRFEILYEGDTLQMYRALRVINPSPYLYFLDFGNEKIIGSSPEILVRTESGIAETYPIAGTRPRGNNDDDDKRIEEELLADEKEDAEHIMLVDLGRNDLGKVCEKNSVNVERMKFIVRYSHVMHIASKVVGKISTGKSSLDVFKATFPAGTVSGAPKVRAMEIIDELETTKKGMYAGAVGYFDFSGTMDVCIAIRTIFATKQKLFIQAGAGIVADSIPEQEFFESVNKAKALIKAIELANDIT